MRAQEIFESSPASLSGSWTRDLVFSKLWLAQELKSILGNQSVPVAYVLGSWYSNMSTILRKAQVPIEHIVDVEKNKKWLATGHGMQQDLGIDGVEYMAADANKIDYRQLGDPGVVINTSTNDMSDHGWFDHIPAGTIVALQGRDAQPEGSEHTYRSPDALLELYPLEQVLYRGSIKLQDPETEYQRHMVIGTKGKENLRELMFMGMSPCTKDCSGHRAGYDWSARHNNAHSASWSDSFNRGAAIKAAGY
jgi:hypothetical protein